MKKKQINILLLDNNQNNIKIIKDLLNDSPNFNFNIENSMNLSNGLEILKSKIFDVILLHPALLDSDDKVSFFQVKKVGDNTPIIILTSIDELDLAIQLVKDGAQDFFLINKLDSFLLTQTIQYSIERQKTQLQLEETQKKWKSIMQNLSVYLFTTDLSGVITYANRSPYGFSKDEIIGKNYLNLINPLFHNIISKAFKKVISNLGKTTCDVKAPKSEKWYRVHIGPILNTSQQLKGLTLILLDITEHKRIEQQILLDQRMDSVGTLAGGIAHDFNNLLTGIIGNLSIIKLNPEKLSDKHMELVEETMRIATQAGDLTKQLQFLSKGYVAEIEEVDLHDIIEDVFSLLDRTTDKLIDYRNDIKKGKVIFNGSKIDLTQIFLNLGTNAVRALKLKGINQNDYIRVKLDTHIPEYLNLNNNLRYIHVVFEDTGIGMDEDTRKRAFEPMYSSSRSKLENETEVSQGWGLGLTMVYNIVSNKYDGKIEVQTEVNKGTKFHLYLCISKYPSHHKEFDDYDDNIQTQKGEIKGILVVDDEESIINLFRTALELEENDRKIRNKFYANDGEQGYEIFKENKSEIDLVVLDINLPGINGIQLFNKIKNIDPSIHIIICSGYSSELIKSNIIQQSDGILPKPIGIEDILNLITSL